MTQREAPGVRRRPPGQTSGVSDILDPRRYLPGRERQFSAPGVLATFREQDKAQAAKRALEEAGFRHVQVDEVSWRPADSGSLREQPWPWTITGEPDKDQRSAAATDPSVSGSSLGGEDVIHGYHYLLTVAAPRQEHARAVAIIRRHGGNVDSGGPR